MQCEECDRLKEIFAEATIRFGIEDSNAKTATAGNDVAVSVAQRKVLQSTNEVRLEAMRKYNDHLSRHRCV